MPTWGSLPRGLPTNKAQCRPKTGTDTNYYNANKYAARDTTTFYYRTRGYGPSRRAEPAKDLEGNKLVRHGSEMAGYGLCNKDTYKGQKIGDSIDLVCEFESRNILRKTVPCRRPFCSTNTNLASNNQYPSSQTLISVAVENNYCKGRFTRPFYPNCPGHIIRNTYWLTDARLEYFSPLQLVLTYNTGLVEGTLVEITALTPGVTIQSSYRTTKYEDKLYLPIILDIKEVETIMITTDTINTNVVYISSINNVSLLPPAPLEPEPVEPTTVPFLSKRVVTKAVAEEAPVTVTETVTTVSSGASPPIAAPSNIVVNNTTNNSLIVSWNSYLEANNGGSPITSFTILLSKNGGLATPVVILDPTVNTFTLHDLVFAAEYTITVSASNSIGRGPESERIVTTVIVASAPMPPSGVTAISNEVRKIPVSWDSYSNDKTGGSSILSYLVHYTPNTNGLSPITVSDPSVTSYTIENLVPTVEYNVMVAATNAIGTGVYSDRVRATPIGTAPPPANVNAISGFNNIVPVIWDAYDTSNNAGAVVTSLLLTYSPNTGGLSPIRITDLTTTNYNIGNLALGTEYTITMTAENAAGIGPSSPPVTATTLS